MSDYPSPHRDVPPEIGIRDRKADVRAHQNTEGDPQRDAREP